MITDPVAVPAIQNLSGVTSATGTLPTGGSTGDTIVCVMGSRGGSALTFATATSGWTKQGQGQQSTGSTLAVFTAAWGSAAPAITWGGTSINGWIQMIVLRGVTAFRTPVFNSGTVATHTASSDTGTVRGTWRLLFAATQGATAYTVLPPGFEIYRSAFGGGGTTNTREECLVAACGNMHESATGTRTFTGAAASWVTCTLLVTPTTATETGLIRCGSKEGTSGTTATAVLDGTHVSGTVTGTCVINNASIFSGGTNTVTGVTAGGTTMTAGPTQQSSQAYDAIHYLANQTATNGTSVNVVTTRSASDSITVFAAEYGGLDTTSPLVASGASTGTGTAISTTTSTVPTAGTRLALHNMGNGNNGTAVTTDANYLPRYSYILGSTGQTPLVVQGREYTADGSSNETAAMTLGISATWAAVIAVFQTPASTGVNANANLQTETETTLAASATGAASAAASLLAWAETVLAASATGGVMAGVNLLGATGSLFTASALTGAKPTPSLLIETETTLSPTVVAAGVAGPVSLQAMTESPFTATAVIVILAAVGLLSETESVFAASGIGGASPTTNLGLEALSSFPVTVLTGAMAGVNLQALAETVFAASAKGGASVAVNTLTVVEPYGSTLPEGDWVTAIGGALVPVNFLTETGSLFAAVGRGGASPAVSLLTDTLSTFAVTALTGAKPTVVLLTETETPLTADVNAPGGVAALVSLQAMTETPQPATVIAGSLVQVGLNLASLTALGVTASGGASPTTNLQSLFESPLGLIASGGARATPNLGSMSLQALTIPSVLGGAVIPVSLQTATASLKALASVLGGAQATVVSLGVIESLFGATVAGILRAANFAHTSAGVLVIPVASIGVGPVDLRSATSTQYPARSTGAIAGPHQSQGEYEP